MITPEIHKQLKQIVGPARFLNAADGPLSKIKRLPEIYLDALFFTPLPI